eukprot:4050577-Prymnesium_polylepis.1
MRSAQLRSASGITVRCLHSARQQAVRPRALVRWCGCRAHATVTETAATAAAAVADGRRTARVCLGDG